MTTYHLSADICVNVTVEADSPQAAYQALRDGAGLADNACLISVDQLHFVMDPEGRHCTDEVSA